MNNHTDNKTYNNVFITVGYLLFVFLSSFPTILFLSHIVGPPEDNQMFVWNLWWFKYAILNLKISPFFTDYLFFPDGASLINHTFTPLNGMAAVILSSIFSFDAAYNILILSTFVVAGWGMYKLCRELGLGDFGSFAAGLIFSFSPFHLAHALHHLNIASIQLLPFVLLTLIKAGQSRKGKYIFFTALILAANFYLSYYIFLFSFLLIIPLLFIKQQRNTGQSDYAYIKPILLSLGLSILFISPLLIPMLFNTASISPGQVNEHPIFSADILAFIIPHHYHWAGSCYPVIDINNKLLGNPWESAAFLGYFVLPVAIWALVKKQIPMKKYFITVAVIGIILALGSSPTILGKQISFIKLPYYIFEHIPGLSAARSPARFVVLVYFSISIFAGVAAQSWWEYLKKYKHKIVRYLGLAGFCLLIMQDCWCGPFVMSQINVPDYYYRIKDDSGDFALVNFPLLGWKPNERYMYYQTVHNKPIIGGQLARSSLEYFNQFTSLTSSPESYKAFHIKYIIVHKEFYSLEYYNDTCSKLKRTMSLFAETDNSTVFKVY